MSIEIQSSEVRKAMHKYLHLLKVSSECLYGFGTRFGIVWNKTSTKSQSRKLSLWQQFNGLIMFAENTITDSSYLFQSPYVDSWIDILIPVTYSNHITSTHAQIQDNKLWTWEFGVILHEKTSKTQLLANGHMLQWISGCFHIYTECVPGQTIASVITKP